MYFQLNYVRSLHPDDHQGEGTVHFCFKYITSQAKQQCPTSKLYILRTSFK